MNKNGVIIQDLSAPAFNLSKLGFNYLGVNSFWTDPLAEIDEAICKELSEKLFHKIENGYFTVLEFVSDPDILFNYLMKCKELNIEVRVLQIESDYSDEICRYDFPITNIIGYEVCEIPFDSQIITDFDWYVPFHKFYSDLNQYGLFKSATHALDFKEAYEYELKNGVVGDGEIDIFICKISEVDIAAFMGEYQG